METEASAPERSWVAALLHHAAALGRTAARLVLPPHCLSCHAPVATDDTLCPKCWSTLRLIEQPFCPRLAIPFSYDLGPGALSAEAIADPPDFERMRAVALYDDAVGRLVSSLKYRDRMELAGAMAGWMARAGGELLAEADLVVPVPLHWRRLWWRRFNQSAVLARRIATLSGRTYRPEVLARVRPTRRQVGMSAKDRADNMRGAFRVPPEMRGQMSGRRVLLVDDVYTSGATVAAATRALLRGGAGAVDVLVFARVWKSSG